MTSALDDIRSEVSELAGVIGAPSRLLPTYGRSEDGARPHIEAHGDALALVVVERGVERERRTTVDRDELLYWILEGVTFSMATSWELQHRDDDQDFRRLLFTHQIELLRRLSRRWAERYVVENQARLREVGLS